MRQLQANRRGVRPRAPSDWPLLNEALGGGFSRGAIHELLAGSPGAPTWTLALRVAARALVIEPSVTKVQRQSGVTRETPDRIFGEQEQQVALHTAPPMPSPVFSPDKWLVYVDAGDFYPPAAAALGVPLDRLIVVRASRPRDVQWICEQALRCRAVAALVAPMPRVDAGLSRRLQLAAEIGGGLGLLLRDNRVRGHTFAASRLRLDPLPQQSGLLPHKDVLSRAGLRRVRVTVLKVREGRSGEPFEIMMTADGRPAVVETANAALAQCA